MNYPAGRRKSRPRAERTCGGRRWGRWKEEIENRTCVIGAKKGERRRRRRTFVARWGCHWQLGPARVGRREQREQMPHDQSTTSSTRFIITNILHTSSDLIVVRFISNLKVSLLLALHFLYLSSVPSWRLPRESSGQCATTRSYGSYPKMKKERNVAHRCHRSLGIVPFLFELKLHLYHLEIFCSR
jgi:hypothetical protein